VVPYRVLPERVRRAEGSDPLLPVLLKDVRTVGVPPVSGSEKTVPRAAAWVAPSYVVPYSVVPEMVTPPLGSYPPPLLLNDANTVGVPPVTGIEKTVPSPEFTPCWYIAPPPSVVP
jgi:hypothetical protein